MAKIGAGITMTVHIGDPQRNEYAKVRISIDEIDTEQEIFPQLQRSAAAIKETYGMLGTIVDRRINEMLGEQADG